MRSSRDQEALTYGKYLRVPELLSLQSPLAEPQVADELLFIIGQQAEELWFKQILNDLDFVIERLESGAMHDVLHHMARVNSILRVLASETEILETIEPAQFHRFRGTLRAASGLESEQFRELEIASGIRSEDYLKFVSRFVDVPSMLSRWPVSLRDAFVNACAAPDGDPVGAIVEIYRGPERSPERYALVESMSEYDLRFQAWRFHHLQVVERVIGDRSAGTAGSAGSPYLARTLGYRIFPELWEARNRLTLLMARP
ncbi:MAG: tryptophan 2,3-dioxygenase family protein [Chloroflexota bacterium]